MRIVPVCCLIALLLGAVAPGVSAQVAKLYPVDETAQDSSLLLFRLRLIEALVSRDTAFVYAHLAPEVKVSFGDPHGPASFKALWQARKASWRFPTSKARWTIGPGSKKSTGAGRCVFSWPVIER